MFRSNAPVSDQRSTGQERPPSTRILVIGAGYAGLLFTMRLGVEIIDQSSVTAVHAQSVVIDQGSELACDLCIWTGGFVAPPLAREAGLAVNEHNQIIVDPFLRSISHPEVYAIGDAASPREDPGVRMRMSAVTATIMGAHGADSLSAVLRGKAPKPLSFAYLGQGIALGRQNAIGFNNYPDDTPKTPYFTGRLGYLIREGVCALPGNRDTAAGNLCVGREAPL